MYHIISMVLKYIFIILIYFFIYNILKLIYLDMKGIGETASIDGSYLKLINKIEDIPYKVREYYAVKDMTTLGRTVGNTIYLNDPYISKEHLKIYKSDNNFYIEDLNSSNGTVLNNREIDDISKLNNGDIIKIGDLEFLFVNRE